MPDVQPRRSKTCVMRISRRPLKLILGPLDVQLGGMRVKRGPVRVPDGLHIWWGARGVHLFWRHSPYAGRVMWDRERPEPVIPDA